MVDVSAGVSAGQNSAFAIGDVIRRALSILGRNLGSFVLMSGLLTLPFLVASLTSADPVVVAGRAHIVSSGLMRHTRTWPFLLPVLQSLAQAPVIAAVFAEIEGQQSPTIDALLTFVRRFAPVAGVAVLQNAAFIAGLALLVIPGIIVWTILYVALPACIGEQRGIMASLKYSASLTKGHRWRIFGLTVVIGMAVVIPTLIIQQLAFKLGGSTGFSVAEYLLQVVFVPLNAIVSTLIYQALRGAREGLGNRSVAEVFA